MFFYAYVLKSNKDQDHYVGFTNDLKRRIEEPYKGFVFSTKPRRPLVLIYYEACVHEKDARQREKYLKTTIGHRWLGKRLRNYTQSV